MVNSIVENPVDGLKFFSHEPNKIGDMEVLINRGGFTGEKFGYEIYCRKDQIAREAGYDYVSLRTIPMGLEGEPQVHLEDCVNIAASVP